VMNSQMNMILMIPAERIVNLVKEVTEA
jgi:hypothetical protein